MARGAVARRKLERREARRPKPEQTRTKAEYYSLPKTERKKHKDGTKYIRLKRPNGEVLGWICVKVEN